MPTITLDATAIAVIAVLAIVVLIGKEGVQLLSRWLFKRTVETEYITVTHCDACGIKRKGDMDDFKREIRNDLGMMRGILLVVATNSKMPIEDLKGLVK